MSTYVYILFTMFLNFLYTSCDIAEDWQLSFQDPATHTVEGMIFFHDYLLIFIVAIGIFVFYFLYRILIQFNHLTYHAAEKFTHSSLLEILWTILPAVVLIFIAVPSFTLLYSLDELIDPEVTLKVVGHQWYWSYEYTDLLEARISTQNGFSVDSYILSTTDLLEDMAPLRLLEVDHKILLPSNKHIRLLVTSADVLHSWAVPSFGVKIDACPGRLSQGSLFIKREGIFYGQCSEICGVNHGFMPIAIRVVAPDIYEDGLRYVYPDII